MTTNARPRQPASRWVAENVKRLRELRRMTQTELAELLTERGFPYNKQRISRIENGRETVDVDKLVALADALAVTPGALVEDTGDLVSRSCRLLDDKWTELTRQMFELKARADAVWFLRTSLELDGDRLAVLSDERKQLWERLQAEQADIPQVWGITPESPGWELWVNLLLEGDWDEFYRLQEEAHARGDVQTIEEAFGREYLEESGFFELFDENTQTEGSD